MNVESFWVLTIVNIFMFINFVRLYNKSMKLLNELDANVFLGFIGYACLIEGIVLLLYFIPQILEHVSFK